MSFIKPIGIVWLSLVVNLALADGHGVMVGGAEMVSDKDVVENASQSSDHSTFVSGLKAADLLETLKGDGPYTVLAPVNAAFDALPAGTVDTLLKPENKELLTTVLSCHVIASDSMASDVIDLINFGDGIAVIETLGGCKLSAKLQDDKVTFTDERGYTATVAIADVRQSNGVMHVIDAIMLPK